MAVTGAITWMSKIESNALLSDRNSSSQPFWIVPNWPLLSSRTYSFQSPLAMDPSKTPRLDPNGADGAGDGSASVIVS